MTELHQVTKAHWCLWWVCWFPMQQYSSTSKKCHKRHNVFMAFCYCTVLSICDTKYSWSCIWLEINIRSRRECFKYGPVRCQSRAWLKHVSQVGWSVTASAATILLLKKQAWCRTLNCIMPSLAQEELSFTLCRAQFHRSSSMSPLAHLPSPPLSLPKSNF